MNKILAAGLVCLMLVTDSVAAFQTNDNDTADLFVIRGVESSAEGASSTEARASAVDAAVVRAFSLMVGKVVEPRNHHLITDPDLATLNGMLTGFEVENERSAARRYSAHFHIAFDDRLVREFMKSRGVPFVMKGPAPAMLHFVWKDRTGAKLFRGREAEEALLSANWQNRIGNYALPAGTFSDRLSLPVDRIVEFDGDAVLDHAATAGISRTLIVVARPVDQDPTGLGAVEYQYLALPEGLGGKNIVRQLPGETLEDMKTRALSRALDRVDNVLMTDLEVSQGDAGVLAIDLETTSMKALGRFRTALTSLPTVDKFRTVAVGLPITRVEIDFTGRRSQLVGALEQAGFSVWFDRETGYRARMNRELETGGDGE